MSLLSEIVLVAVLQLVSSTPCIGETCIQVSDETSLLQRQQKVNLGIERSELQQGGEAASQSTEEKLASRDRKYRNWKEFDVPEAMKQAPAVYPKVCDPSVVTPVCGMMTGKAGTTSVPIAELSSLVGAPPAAMSTAIADWKMGATGDSVSCQKLCEATVATLPPADVPPATNIGCYVGTPGKGYSGYSHAATDKLKFNPMKKYGAKATPVSCTLDAAPWFAASKHPAAQLKPDSPGAAWGVPLVPENPLSAEEQTICKASTIKGVTPPQAYTVLAHEQIAPHSPTKPADVAEAIMNMFHVYPAPGAAGQPAPAKADGAKATAVPK